MKSVLEVLSDKKIRFVLLIVLIIVIVIILMMSMLGGSGVINEATMTDAATKYTTAYPSALPRDNYETKKIPIATLISSGYLNGKADGANCPSYVYVTKVNDGYDYTPVIRCNEVNVRLSSKITRAGTVSSGDGLYKTANGYIFKGENPNNYVKFASSLWRVMSISNDGIVKMIYADNIPLQESYVPWDDRYNTNFPYQGTNAGINTYSVSRLKEFLYNIPSKYSEKFKGSQISRMTTHSVCTGKLAIGKGSNLCATVDNNTYISIMTVSDYINAARSDSKCSTVNSKNCQNYNYLYNVNLNCWTITADATNTYSAYYIDANEGITSAWAYINHCIKPVITLKSDVLFVSGSGTHDNPYQIG